MNDSIFTKMMLSLQESKKIEAKANLKALKESKGVNEDISQDSQIKTTNKGTEKEELDAIKPATGADGIPAKAVNDTKLDAENPDANPQTDANINAAVNKTKLESEVTLTVDDKTVEISDDNKVTVTTDAAAPVETEIIDEIPAPVEEPVEDLDIVDEIEEPAEDLEVADDVEEPVEDEEIEEEEDEFIDESTFNPFLNKFIKENYSNAKSVKIESVRMNKRQLTLECKLTFNSGKTSKFNLGLRGIVKEGKSCKLRGYDNGYFKAESVKAPLTFKVSYRNNTLRCEGLEYNFNTKLNEGRMKNIKGKLIIAESKKPAMRTRRSRRIK